jgi:hypothetical protein
LVDVQSLVSEEMLFIWKVDDARRTPHDDGRRTQGDHNSSPWALLRWAKKTLTKQNTISQYGKHKHITYLLFLIKFHYLVDLASYFLYIRLYRTEKQVIMTIFNIEDVLFCKKTIANKNYWFKHWCIWEYRQRKATTRKQIIT